MGGGPNDERSKKSKKSKKKKKDKKSKDDGSLTLSQNLVTAGHARKMRESKDLTKKSKEDMAAVFGMKVEDYQTNSVWGRLSSLSAQSSSVEDGEEKKIDDCDMQNNATISEKEKKRKSKKKRKRDKDVTTSIDESIENEEKKQKKKKKRKEKGS